MNKESARAIATTKLFVGFTTLLLIQIGQYGEVLLLKNATNNTLLIYSMPVLLGIFAAMVSYVCMLSFSKKWTIGFTEGSRKSLLFFLLLPNLFPKKGKKGCFYKGKLVRVLPD